MLAYSLQGPHQPTRGEAVAAAVAECMGDYGDDAEIVHVHVIQVLEIKGEYCAIVQITLEPRLEEEEKLPEPEPENLQEKRRREIEEAQLEEEEKHRQEFYQEIHHEPGTHIFIPSVLEPGYLYEPSLYLDHPEYRFHFLEAGSSMWEASLRVHPDMDLFTSAHEIDVNPLVNYDRELKNEPGLKPRHKPAVLALSDDY